MTTASSAGPVWTGDFERVVVTQDGQTHTMLFLPDLNNDKLRDAGLPQCFYYLPQTVRIAQADDKDYKFHLTHFVGVQDADSNVGVKGTRETAGGVLGFTITCRPSDAVLAAAQVALQQQLSAESAPRFQAFGGGWLRRMLLLDRPDVPPRLAPVPVQTSTVAIANNTMDGDGNVTSGGHDNPWYWNMQGAGAASVDVLAENAYTAMVGDLPAALLWNGFHGEYSTLAVQQAIGIPVWGRPMTLTITGDWHRCFEHFSMQAAGRAFWTNIDIAVELNALHTSGAITVELSIDGTVPGADKLEEEIQKQKALITQILLEQAKSVIFAPMPTVKPAEAKPADGPGGFLGSVCGFGGGGFALKYQKDTVDAHFTYTEIVNRRFLQPTVIGGTLDGFYDVIKADPDAEKKYFTTLYLDDWSRKITRFARPVVDWPAVDSPLVGDPVDSVSVNFFYPASDGSVSSRGAMFTAPTHAATPPATTDPGTTAPESATLMEGSPSAVFVLHTSRKDASDVTHLPEGLEGWEPDVTYVKRTVHFRELGDDAASQYVHVTVEQPTVELDPGRYGTPVTAKEVEVRASDTGVLAVGPIFASLDFDDDTEVFELWLRPHGTRADGGTRPVSKFRFTKDDVTTPRLWKIYTGQADFVTEYDYRVHVLVKGTLKHPDGDEWYGPWTPASGNGELTFHVPAKTDVGVVTTLTD